MGGHEGAGVVVAKGDLVTDIEIGDHAGIKVIAFSVHAIRSLCLTSFRSGSMAPASPVISANRATNPFVHMPSFLATPSMVPFSNTP